MSNGTVYFRAIEGMKWRKRALRLKPQNFVIFQFLHHFKSAINWKILLESKTNTTLTIWLTRFLCLEKIRINQKKFG